MSFYDKTLYGRDDDMDDYGDGASTYDNNLDEEYEEEEEEEEAAEMEPTAATRNAAMSEEPTPIESEPVEEPKPPKPAVKKAAKKPAKKAASTGGAKKAAKKAPAKKSAKKAVKKAAAKPARCRRPMTHAPPMTARQQAAVAPAHDAACASNACDG